eukprot:scpid12358/ scgid11153/ Ral GTPase-activating protein subunit beta; p170
MFSGWVAFRPPFGDAPGGPISVLDKFPPETGLSITIAVVDSILPLRVDATHPPVISTEDDVDWIMNVLAYGLRLPLEYDENIRKCCQLYQDWLNVLVNLPSTAPTCIRHRPEFYARRILEQFEGVFNLRNGSDGSKVAVHIRLCMYVLGIIQRLAFHAKLSQTTWNTLLNSLVRVCDRLLSPPCGMYGTLAERIGESLVQALYNVWIKACDGNFPAPALWKTMQEAVIGWRHQRPVVDEWTRVCEALTRSVVRHLYGGSHGDELSIKASYEDGTAETLNLSIAADALVQCWYRFLLILGNPVELSRPQIIGKTPAFHQAAADSGDLEQQHTCLQRLPTIFLLAQRGVASLVDLFLELSVQPGQLSRAGDDDESHNSVAMSPTAAVTAEPRVHDVAGSAPISFLPASLFSAAASSRNANSPSRPALPKRSTLLHIFGEWLFQAALPSPEDLRNINRIMAGGSAANAAGRIEDGYGVGVPLAAFEAGRAEALACLCRIFCASCCDEKFVPVYLARFYYVLQQGLVYLPSYHRGDVLSNLLINSTEIFCNDLAGAFCLVPGYLAALEFVLPMAMLPFSSNVNVQDLRFCSTRILMSLLCVPMHFNDLTVCDLSLSSKSRPDSGKVPGSKSDYLISPVEHDPGSTRFASFRGAIVNLVFSALRCEKSPAVIQLLLGAVMVMVQDVAAVEKARNSEAASDPTARPGTSSTPAAAQSPTADGNLLGAEPGAHLGSLRNSSSGVMDAAALCVRACRDITQRFLRVDPSNSVHVTMSVLDLMSGLASLNLPGVSGVEWRYTVRWLCDFINTLVCQPPRAHSRDLHSMIVAAYHCLLAWTTCNHRLLFEEEPLRAVLDVCELGLTGSKSVSKPRDDEEPVKSLRGEKEFRPVSRRVLEAAEMVLYAILEHLGAFPPPMGPGAVSSMLDEAALIKLASRYRNVSDLAFSYYAVDSTTLVGLLPCSVTSDTGLPAVTVILRGPSGRHTWTMQLRQVPRHAQPQLVEQLAPVRRPEPHSDPPPVVLPPRPPWPDVVKTMPVTEADSSIPSLSDILDPSTAKVHDRVQDLVKQQSALEREFVANLPGSKFNVKPVDMKPPRIRDVFQTSRLLMSHLGLVTPESLMSSFSKSVDRPDSFTLVDSEKASFQPQLQNLDGVPTRHTDTVYVFYVRPGQSSLGDLLSNRNLLGPQKPEFAEFLNALGWPVDLGTHPGFKGAVSCLHSPNDAGQSPMPYFADNNSEVLFVVPSLQKRARQVIAKLQEHSNASNSDGAGAAATSSSAAASATGATGTGDEIPSSVKMDILGQCARDLDLPPGAGVASCASSSSLTPFPTAATNAAAARSAVTPLAWQLDTSIIIVWLERFEDWASFPLGKIGELVTPLHGSSMAGGNLPVQALFVHPLNTGLYRIKRVSPPSSRWVMAGPLLSDMVVSRRSLGPLVRQTVMNMAKRRRIVSDSYSPPHALRKRRVEDLCKSHAVKQTVPDFYSALFRV